MKTLIAFCLLAVICGKSIAQENYNIHDVTFTDANNGWAVTDYGIIIRTSNGGEIWTQQSSGTNNHLLSVSFVDSNTGWVVGEAGTVIKTTNGGLNWEILPPGITTNIENVFFTDNDNGWIISKFWFSWCLYRSTDGGLNWMLQSNLEISPSQVYFTDFDNGWIAGFLSEWGSSWGKFSHTTDGGNSWIYQSIPDSFNNTPLSVYFTDSQNGWAVGHKDWYLSGLILKTTDGGNNWTEYPNEVNEPLNSVCFVNENLGWCAGNSGTIMHTTDGGTNWYLQSAGVSSDLLSVCFTDSVNGWISGNNGALIQTSDGGLTWASQTFSAITLLSPAGGEVWLNGTNHELIWISSNIGFVKIELSIDNGLNWDIIQNSIPNNGTYSWVVNSPVPSEECLIKISDAENNTLYDISDSVFTIRYISILSPNGGEFYYAGTTEQIFWSSFISSDVKIDLSVDNGENWDEIIYSTPNTGVFTWEVNALSSSLECLIRISDVSDSSIYDISDDVFSIQHYTLTSPDGGELWYVGDTEEITWSSHMGCYVNLEISIDSGVSWNNIVNDAPNNGSYSWLVNIPVPSSECLIKISHIHNSSHYDISNDIFNIEHITLQSPNGGEFWLNGTTKEIKWIAPSIEYVSIELSTDNGNNWSTLVDSLNNTGSYQWQINVTAFSDNCLIKVSDISNSEIFDISENVFSIAPCTITVQSPNGGEVWPIGSNQEITWSDENVDYVKIEYSIDNGVNWSVIRHSISSAGSYMWVVNSPEPSTECLIRICNRDHNNIFDISDSVFVISGSTGILELFGESIPTEFDLMQNFPNPFNPVTKIYYALPEVSNVEIKLYDVLGKELQTLVKEIKEAGYHKIIFDASNLPSGIYFYKLQAVPTGRQAGSFVKTNKMILLK